MPQKRRMCIVVRQYTFYASATAHCSQLLALLTTLVTFCILCIITLLPCILYLSPYPPLSLLAQGICLLCRPSPAQTPRVFPSFLTRSCASRSPLRPPVASHAPLRDPLSLRTRTCAPSHLLIRIYKANSRFAKLHPSLHPIANHQRAVRCVCVHSSPSPRCVPKSTPTLPFVRVSF